jgi:hypothetical protein
MLLLLNPESAGAQEIELTEWATSWPRNGSLAFAEELWSLPSLRTAPTFSATTSRGMAISRGFC